MKCIKNNLDNGMQKFTIIWFGQFISTMGSAMTAFALMLWIYDKKAMASTTALLSFFWILPFILFSPLAGVIADRYNRKAIMFLSDVCAGLTTFALFMLYATGHMHIWHLYLSQALSGAFGAFQQPAFSSSISTLITKEHYERASGLRSFSDAFSKVMAPILAGIILLQFNLKVIMVIDVLTCLFAATSLLLIKWPQFQISPQTKVKKTKVWSEFRVSLLYLRKRKGLLVLLLLFFSINLQAASAYFGILSPMILARSHNNKMVLVTIQALLGIGGVVGSIIVSIWGCPKNKVRTILVTTFASFLCGDLLLSLGKNVVVWGIGAFLSAAFIPFLVGANFAIWQKKIHPHMQGRIFSIKGMLEQSAMPFGYLAGGYLADYVFEPFMAKSSSISRVLGGLVGEGNGSGMAVMFIISAVLGCGSCLVAYLFKDFRHLEIMIPDHDHVDVAS